MAELGVDLRGRLARPLRIVSIGNELLRGDIADGNAAWLASRLAALGAPPDSISQIGDDLALIAAAVRAWRAEGGCLILGGGLGPTVDDMTREAVAAALDAQLVEDPRALAWIRERESRGGRRYRDGTLGQARSPVGSEPLPNPRGTAPGFLVNAAGGFLLVVPGVPGEYREICGACLPGPESRSIASNWTLTGPGEDVLAEILADFPGRERLGYYPSFSGYRLRVPDGVDGSDLALRLAPWLVSSGGENLETVLVRLLAERGETVACAESCTGGLIGARLTEVPGASAVFPGGIVSYSNRVKEELLGVRRSLLIEHGAVSRPVALAMALGVRRALASDWGVAATGIAGPDGGTDGKPVGTLHVAVAGPEGVSAHAHRLAVWDRADNRHFAAQSALALLWEQLRAGGKTG